MSDVQPAVVTVASSANLPVSSADERRVRWFEVGLVLFVTCGGYIANSLFLLKSGPGANQGISDAQWAASLIHEAASLLLLGYVLWRRGQRLTNLGLGWSLKDVGVGLLVACLSYVAYVLGGLFVQVIHYRIYGSFSHQPTGTDVYAHPGVMMIPFCLLNPFFEELIVRAYLMTEVIQLTGSAPLAMLVSVLVQFSYHLYYGWTLALTMSFSFLTLAIYYALFRRALPIIVAHGFFDISALVRLW